MVCSLIVANSSSPVFTSRLGLGLYVEQSESERGTIFKTLSPPLQIYCHSMMWIARDGVSPVHLKMAFL